MKNSDVLSLEKIRDIIYKNQGIGIIVKDNPTLDEMAAGLSLYLSLLNSGKQVSIVCPAEPIVEISSLVGIDKVKTAFETSKFGDLTVSFPYKEGEIEKISYTLENGFLNILVKAGEEGLSFNENDVRYKRPGATKEVIFTIGVPRLSEISIVLDMNSLKNAKIINIDNKKENQQYGDIILVLETPSISEQLAFILLSLGLKIDVDIAQNLLSGISNATDNFQSAATSPLSLEMAAALMKKGATRKRVTGRTPAETDRKSFFSQSSQNVNRNDKKEEDTTPPSDWLAPKIYKGSTAI